MKTTLGEILVQYQIIMDGEPLEDTIHYNPDYIEQYIQSKRDKYPNNTFEYKTV